MDRKKDVTFRHGEPQTVDVHLDPATFERGKADLAHVVSLAGSNTVLRGFLVEAAQSLSPGANPGDGPRDGNRLAYKGKVHNLPQVPWKLLAEMWGHESRNMHDVMDRIWDVA